MIALVLPDSLVSAFLKNRCARGMYCSDMSMNSMPQRRPISQ